MRIEIMTKLEGLGRMAQKLGPYLLLEIILPGGTLVALLLFLYQSGRLQFMSSAVRRAVYLARGFGSALEQGVFALQPCYAWPVDRPHRRDRRYVAGFAVLTMA